MEPLLCNNTWPPIRYLIPAPMTEDHPSYQFDGASQTPNICISAYKYACLLIAIGLQGLEECYIVTVKGVISLNYKITHQPDRNIREAVWSRPVEASRYFIHNCPCRDKFTTDKCYSSIWRESFWCNYSEAMKSSLSDTYWDPTDTGDRAVCKSCPIESPWLTVSWLHLSRTWASVRCPQCLPQMWKTTTHTVRRNIMTWPTPN